jgi:hypothetical protein
MTRDLRSLTPSYVEVFFAVALCFVQVHGVIPGGIVLNLQRRSKCRLMSRGWNYVVDVVLLWDESLGRARIMVVQGLLTSIDLSRISLT